MACAASSVAYAESAERGVSIIDYRPDLGEDYLALAAELLNRLGWAEERAKVDALRTGAGEPSTAR